MNIKYTLGALVSIPLLPLMYYQGKKIKASVPVLPEAEGPSGTVSIEKPKEKITLVTLGESTIAGIGVKTHDEGFSGTLAKELSTLMQSNVKWQVYARSGYTAARVREKLVPKITVKQIDIIVIGLGGNDAFTLNRPQRWRRHVRELINDLKQRYPNALIVFCNMPPIKEFPAFTGLIKFTVGNLVEILGKEMAILVKEYDNVHYLEDKISLENWTRKFQIEGSVSDFFSDGVHPSKLTYQTWAKEVAQYINNVLK